MLIVSHALHYKVHGKYFAYGPMVREMRIWEKYVKNITIVAPFSNEIPTPMDLDYKHPNLRYIKVPAFSLIDKFEVLNAFLVIPLISFKLIREFFKAEHIHLRCPGNLALIACILQVFFPSKIKTVKYAGNWDPRSNQPLSYRLQRFILNSKVLTRNCKVLVYGNWQSNSSNIIPFYTASYSKEDSKNSFPLTRSYVILKLIFVGSLIPEKNPIVSLEVLKHLKDLGIKAKLVFCGDGPERSVLENFSISTGIQASVTFLGKVPPEIIKKELITSHFLIFISDSEGWPKAVAESMWWGCIPVTTSVSCVAEMLGKGKRGFLVEKNSLMIANLIKSQIQFPHLLNQMRTDGINWARQFTLERFDSDVKKILEGKFSESELNNVSFV